MFFSHNKLFLERTPGYDTTGKHYFDFPKKIRSKYQNKTIIVDTDTQPKYLKPILYKKAKNKLCVYIADNYYFIVLTYDDINVTVLDIFDSESSLNSFLSDVRKDAERANRKLKKDIAIDLLTLIMLTHDLNSENLLQYPLIKFAKNKKAILLAVDTYNSLSKHRYIDEISVKSLSMIEVEALKLSVFSSHYSSIIPCDLHHQATILFLSNINDGAFKKFGISDEEIIDYFKTVKMNMYYFVDRYRKGEDKTYMYYTDRNNFYSCKSFLDEEDQLFMFKSFNDIVYNQFKYFNKIYLSSD